MRRNKKLKGRVGIKRKMKERYDKICWIIKGISIRCRDNIKKDYLEKGIL